MSEAEHIPEVEIPEVEKKEKSGRSVPSEKQLAVLAAARLKAVATVKRNAEKRKELREKKPEITEVPEIAETIQPEPEPETQAPEPETQAPQQETPDIRAIVREEMLESQKSVTIPPKKRFKFIHGVYVKMY